MSASSSKSDRKAAAAEAETDQREFEETPFGRRRITKLPKAVWTLLWLVGIPFVLVYRRMRSTT